MWDTASERLLPFSASSCNGSKQTVDGRPLADNKSSEQYIDYQIVNKFFETFQMWWNHAIPRYILNSSDLEIRFPVICPCLNSFLSLRDRGPQLPKLGYPNKIPGFTWKIFKKSWRIQCLGWLWKFLRDNGFWYIFFSLDVIVRTNCLTSGFPRFLNLHPCPCPLLAGSLDIPLLGQGTSAPMQHNPRSPQWAPWLSALRPSHTSKRPRCWKSCVLHGCHGPWEANSTKLEVRDSKWKSLDRPSCTKYWWNPANIVDGIAQVQKLGCETHHIPAGEVTGPLT